MLPSSADRVAALRNLSILDTSPEAVFDDIVQITAALCDVPIALVSLVEIDRQWFKARVGLDLSQTPIEQSVCALAIQQSDVFVIEDLASDARTATNALVTADGGIRFYAGAPLVTTTGIPIGSLCAIDTKPRPGGLTERQSTALKALARQVVDAIESRQEIVQQSTAARSAQRSATDASARLGQSEARLDLLALSEARLRLAQEAARIGTFELEIDTDVAVVSAEFCRLLGIPVSPTCRFRDLEALMLPDEDATHSTFQTRGDGSAPLDVEYRIRRADDGQVRWLARRAAFEIDGSGRPVRMLGSILDVTKRRLANERVLSLLKLGDRLSLADSVSSVAEIASDILSSTLQATRCGFISIGASTGTFTVEQERLGSGAESTAGTYPLSIFAATAVGLRGLKLVSHEDVYAAQNLTDDWPAYRQFATTAQITVPLAERGETKALLFVHEGDKRTWSLEELAFVEGVADRTYAAIAKINAEEQRDVLSHELSHRLKNMLAMIQAVARQTLKGATERDALDAFENRLIALSSAHDVLFRQDWSSAPIEQVVAEVVRAAGVHERVTVIGPTLRVAGRAVLGLSLLVHELTTNALKYGALSAPEGRVEITWTIDDAIALPTLNLIWRERGGPPPAASPRRGFGSRLLSMGLVGTGGCELDFTPLGLDASFTASLAGLKSET